MKSKHILGFDSLVNESANDDKNFYSKFWINALENEFGKTEVDKIKEIKPLYGGGNYVFIGYDVKLNDDKFDKFILEGIAKNGEFMSASVILYKGSDAIMHGALDIEYNAYKGGKIDNSIAKTIKAIKSKIAENKKK